MNLSEELASQIWDILVETCGASERGREDFVNYSSVYSVTEYRFQGMLGFGGKIYTRPLRVKYYREDETAEREAMVAKANEKLKGLMP